MDAAGEQIPGRRAPRSLPLLGHALRLLRDPLRFLCSLPGSGDLVEVRIASLPVVVVCDPDLARQVLLDDRTFDEGGFFYDRGRAVAGDGLITCAHAAHRRQRRLSQPAFRGDRLAGYGPIMTEQAAALTTSWRDGQILDVLSETTVFASRVVVATPTAPPVNTARSDSRRGRKSRGVSWCSRESGLGPGAARPTRGALHQRRRVPLHRLALRPGDSPSNG